MAVYCTNCGAPVNGSFCTGCGARVQAAAAPPQPAAPPVAAAPVQPAAKSSGAGKALLMVGGIFLAIVLVGIAALAYGVHWMKNKVLERASTYTGGAVGGRRQVAVANGRSCELLSRDDVQQILGVPVERTSEVVEGSDAGCAYYTNPAAFVQLQKVAMEQAKRDSEAASKEPQPKTDNPLELLKHTREMEGIVKTFGLSEADKDGRVFAFFVQRNFGRENWSGLRKTLSIVPGFDELSDVGDAAMIGSFGHAVYVLKGDNVIRLETMAVPEARVRGADLGRRIASHL